MEDDKNITAIVGLLERPDAETEKAIAVDR